MEVARMRLEPKRASLGKQPWRIAKDVARRTVGSADPDVVVRDMPAPFSDDLCLEVIASDPCPPFA